MTNRYIYPYKAVNSEPHRQRVRLIVNLFQRAMDDSILSEYTTEVSYHLHWCGTMPSDANVAITIVVMCWKKIFKELRALLTSPFIRSQYDPSANMNRNI